MEELKREEEKYHDFLFIDVEEQYLRLPYKTYELKSSVCPSLYDFLSNHRPYSAYFPPPNLSGWHSLKPHLIYLRQNIILKPTMTSTCVLVSSSFSWEQLLKKYKPHDSTMLIIGSFCIRPTHDTSGKGALSSEDIHWLYEERASRYWSKDEMVGWFIFDHRRKNPDCPRNVNLLMHFVPQELQVWKFRTFNWIRVFHARLWSYLYHLSWGGSSIVSSEKWQVIHSHSYAWLSFTILFIFCNIQPK